MTRDLPFSLAKALTGKLPTSVSEIVDGILGGILKTLLVFGALAVFTGIQVAMESHGTDPSPLTATLLISSYLITYLLVALVTFLPRPTRSMKVFVVLFAFYFMGVLGLLESGLIGDGRLFLFGMIILTAVFFGFTATVWGTLLSVATMAAVGWAALTTEGAIWGVFDATGAGDDALSWISAAIIFLLIAAAAVVAVTYLKSVLVRSLEEADLAREQYQELYEQIPSMYFTVDPSFQVRSVNRFGAEQLGYGSGELEGRTILELASPIDAETVKENLQDVEGSREGPWEWEMRLQKKDGSEVWVAAVARRQAPDSILLVCRDISESKELEERFLHSQKMEVVGQLAGGVAHDFNNLLVPIMGHADMAVQRLSPDDPAGRNLEQIIVAADRAAELSQQLLSFSRRQITDPRELELNQIISGFQRLIRRVIGEDIELETNLQPDLWPVWGGPAQIEQVLMNLAVNARDAMENRGRLTLETANVVLDPERAGNCVGDRASGPHVMIAVTDTGRGIPERMQERIFDPFFTTKDPGKGTGLGLATVFGIVIQHQGSIGVQSVPGEGARFEIFLPRSEEGGKAVEATEEETVLVGNETILVVEDDGMVREVVNLTLEGLGYQVLEASLPSEGLRVAREHEGPIHLLLTDVVLPEMDGPELWREMAKLRPEARVLYMSGYTRGVALVGKVAGENPPLLHKPFKTAALTRAIREALDR